MGIEEGHHKSERKPLTIWQNIFECFVYVCLAACFIGAIVYLIKMTTSLKEAVPKIELAYMDFTVLNITDTRLSAKWDMSIRIPNNLPSSYICLQGDLQASFIYKNVTLATSSPHKYNNLKYSEPQVLRVSAGVLGEDIDGLIGKDITEDIKEKKEVRFGTRFDLTDCREKTTGAMRYECDEVILRFEPGSEMKAALFGMNPSCVNY